MNEQIDVMFPLGPKSSWEHNELRYALRSLEENFLAMGRVFVVGERPKWLRNVIHIPADDVYRRNKDANIITKVLLACCNGISKHFLRCSDDQCLLRPATVEELMPRHTGHVRGDDAKMSSENKWWKRWFATRDVLKERGLPALYFETHVPAIYDRDEFMNTMLRYPYGAGIGYCINTLYFNGRGHKENVIRSRGDRYNPPQVHDTLTVEQFLHEFQKRLFLGYNDGQLSDTLKQAMARKFPHPSRFEDVAVRPVRVPAVPKAASSPPPEPPSISEPSDVSHAPKSDIRVWTYWTGPKPPWVSLCMDTLQRNVPGIEVLDMQSWEKFYEESGGDMEVWQKMPKDQFNLHSDMIRCWCLRTFGGIWLDADCIAYKDIRPIWEYVKKGARVVTYNLPWRKPRHFLYSAVLAAPKGSPIMELYWEKLSERVKRGTPLGFTSIGPYLLSASAREMLKEPIALIKPMELVHQYYTSKVRIFPGDSPDRVPEDAYCTMLTHRALMELRHWSREQLLNGNSCASFLYRRALGMHPC